MPDKIRHLAMAAGAAIVLSSGLALAETDADSAIQYRKAVMGAVGSNMKGSALIIQGKVGFTDNLVGHAQAIAAAAKLAPAAFEQNTDGQGGEKTTATAKVWSDWAKEVGGDAQKLIDMIASTR